MTTLSRMTDTLVRHGRTDVGTIGALQAAGFTGAEIAVHLDRAVAAANLRLGCPSRPDPAFVRRHRALSSFVGALLGAA